MEGKVFSEEKLELMTKALAEDVMPRDSWRAGKDFRLHIIKTLAKKEIRRAVKNQGAAE